MWIPLSADDPTDGLVQFVKDNDGGSRTSWSVDVRGGTRGIMLLQDSAEDSEGATEESGRVADPAFVSFQPVGRDSLPVLAEQFIRGDELHLWYPQREGSFSLRLVLQPIHVTDDMLVLEAILSVQTDLLDSHPMIDIEASAASIRRLSSSSENDHGGSAGAPPISLCESPDHSIAVVLGPHDCPFTLDQSRDQQLRLRLFGDFLEKGVIRKARPWLVLSRSPRALEESTLRQRWVELSQSPLPLTP